MSKIDEELFSSLFDDGTLLIAQKIHPICSCFNLPSIIGCIYYEQEVEQQFIYALYQNASINNNDNTIELLKITEKINRKNCNISFIQQTNQFQYILRIQYKQEQKQQCASLFFRNQDNILVFQISKLQIKQYNWDKVINYFCIKQNPGKKKTSIQLSPKSDDASISQFSEQQSINQQLNRCQSSTKIFPETYQIEDYVNIDEFYPQIILEKVDKQKLQNITNYLDQIQIQESKDICEYLIKRNISLCCLGQMYCMSENETIKNDIKIEILAITYQQYIRNQKYENEQSVIKQLKKIIGYFTLIQSQQCIIIQPDNIQEIIQQLFPSDTQIEINLDQIEKKRLFNSFCYHFKLNFQFDLQMNEKEIFQSFQSNYITLKEFNNSYCKYKINIDNQ